MQYQSVRAIASRLKSQFKVDMDIFDVVQGCADALKKMGYIALQRSGMTITTQDIYFPPQLIFTYDESDDDFEKIKLLKDNYIPQFKGPYIDYVWDCPYVKFNETDVNVAVEVTEIKLDSEKFPMIPEPAFYGCLYYCLYIYYQPLFLLKQTDPNTMMMIEQWKERNIAQSNHGMMMESLTANERDNLFNIMTSMDRKTFGLPS